MEVKFSYKPWDSKVDVLIPRPRTSLGAGMVRSAVKVGRYLTRRQERGRTPGLALDEVVALITGGIEWARWYGLTPAELQRAVKQNLEKVNNTASARKKREVARFQGISDINAPRRGLKETRNLPR